VWEWIVGTSGIAAIGLVGFVGGCCIVFSPAKRRRRQEEEDERLKSATGVAGVASVAGVAVVAGVKRYDYQPVISKWTVTF
jgi:hypothetical protein